MSLKLVPVGFPERLALGVAIGTPAYFISSRAILFEGIRIPTVSEFAVRIFGTISFFCKIIVKGPGKNSFIRAYSNFVIFFVS